MSDAILACENLTKRFEATVAVDNLTVEIYDEFTSLIGPNGAGKTTLFNLFSGMQKPTAGHMTILSEDMTELPPHERVHWGLSRAYQVTNLFAELSAFENVRLAVQAISDVNYVNIFEDALDDSQINARAHEILDTVSFDEERSTAANNLSQGYKRLLELAVALAADPEILLLDEPTGGLAVDKKDRIFNVIDDIAEQHAVLLIEHKLDVVREMSDRLLVMHNGKLLAAGTPEQVLADDDVQAAYFQGGSA